MDISVDNTEKSTMDFGELKNDVDFVTKATNLSNAIGVIESHMKRLESISYESLTKEDKVKYDIFQTYAINSLFWMYLKLQGDDPSQHGITHELSRIKEAMKREKLFQDKKTMPRIDKGASKRFIKHGLKISRDADTDDNNGPNKRKRLD